MADRRQKFAFYSFAILHFIAFLFYLIGTPLIQLKVKHVAQSQPKSCFTMWKFYSDCSKHESTLPLSTLFNDLCAKRIKNFNAAAAFAVISIIVLLVTAICGVTKTLISTFPRFICFSLNVASIVFSSVPWILIAHIFTGTDVPPTYYGLVPDTSLCVGLNNRSYYYGPGFVLMVIAWVLTIIALPLVFVYN